jgi:hypothetical protein
LREKNPPSKERILREYIEQMDLFETVLADFCRGRDIEFISLTNILREKMASGIRAYFTYDQHWSPQGHKIVADFLADNIDDRDDEF